MPWLSRSRTARSSARGPSRPTSGAVGCGAGGAAGADREVGAGVGTGSGSRFVSAGSWRRIACSSPASSGPGSRPVSSASSSRKARSASSASTWRPDRSSATAWTARRRSRSGSRAMADSAVERTLACSPRPEQAEEPGFLRRHPEPLERGPLGQDVGVVRQVGVRFAVPRGEGFVELLDEGRGLLAVGPAGRVALAELAGQRCEAALGGAHVGPEPVHVDRLPVDVEQVAVVGGLQHRRGGPCPAVRLQRLAEAGDVRVQRTVRGRRRLAGPDQVREEPGRDRTARRHGQCGDDRARLAGADVDGCGVVSDGAVGASFHAGSPEDEHAHRHTVTAAPGPTAALPAEPLPAERPTSAAMGSSIATEVGLSAAGAPRRAALCATRQEWTAGQVAP